MKDYKESYIYIYAGLAHMLVRAQAFDFTVVSTW